MGIVENIECKIYLVTGCCRGAYIKITMFTICNISLLQCFSKKETIVPEHANLGITEVFQDVTHHVTKDVLDAFMVEVLDVFANCIMITLICCFGIFGNTVNILVLSQHGFKDSTNIALLSLSISDLVYCMILPLTQLACIVNYVDKALAITVKTFGTVYFFMPKYVAAGNSFWVIVLIAAERFTAVFFPFKVAVIFSRRAMTKIVVFIASFSLAALFPTFFAFRFEWWHDGNLNQTVAIIRPTYFYTYNKAILDMYMWLVLNNIFCTLTMLLVLFLCVAIGFKLSRAAVRREKMTSRTTGYDVKVVKMLVTVCLVYLCVLIPAIIMHIYFNPDFIDMPAQAKVATDICSILYAVNASANFLIYVSMSEKFARTYRRMFSFKTCSGSK